MSLKSRKSIDIAGEDIHEEYSISWLRNPDKTYTKVTNITHRDRNTGVVKPMKLIKPTSEGPFDVVSSADEADDHFEYLGPDNKPVYVYLRRAHEKNTDED